MPRQVKLQDLGIKGDQTTAFRAPNNKYYSSEEAWNKIYEKNEQWRQKVIDMLINVLGYQPGMKLPTITYKKISEYDVYGYDVLYKTIANQMKSISWALNNKNFNSETAKIMYIFAIIQNHAGAEWKNKVAEERRVQKMLKDDSEPEIELKPQKKKTKNISKFLEDMTYGFK